MCPAVTSPCSPHDCPCQALQPCVLSRCAAGLPLASEHRAQGTGHRACSDAAEQEDPSQPEGEAQQEWEQLVRKSELLGYPRFASASLQRDPAPHRPCACGWGSPPDEGSLGCCLWKSYCVFSVYREPGSVLTLFYISTNFLLMPILGGRCCYYPHL